MSLTPRDLKLIGNLFEEKFEEKFEHKFEEKFEQKFEEKFEKKFEEKFDQKFKKEFGPIRREIHKIKENLDMLVSNTDRRLTDKHVRLQTIERHLGLSTPPSSY
jgi:hypothetical protein